MVVFWHIILANLSNCNLFEVSYGILGFASDVLQLPIIFVFKLSHLLVFDCHLVFELAILGENGLITLFPVLLLVSCILKPSFISIVHAFIAVDLIL
jgi:hypothetical protein